MRRPLIAILPLIAVGFVGSAHGQSATQPTNEEALVAIGRASMIGKPFKVEVEKCGSTSGHPSIIPLPPDALVCTTAVQWKEGQEPQGKIVVYFFSAKKWNAILF